MHQAHATKRLYRDDPYLAEFDATVVNIVEVDGERALVLDRTAFYPGGGGQPPDAGRIGGAEVSTMLEQGEEIIHVVPAFGGKQGEAVSGIIDWDRRYDHMRQHTGQHILSAVLDRKYRIQTLSFHLGGETSTIDLSIERLDEERIEAIEDEISEIVGRAAPIRHTTVNTSELKNRKLRRKTSRKGPIRLLEIEGVDLSACGGTHLRTTAEAGPMKIVGQERMRGHARIHFLCGSRALADYRRKDAALRRIAQSFSIHPDDLEKTMENILREQETLRRRLKELEDVARKYDIVSLRRLAERIGDWSLIVHVCDEAGMNRLRLLAKGLVEEERTIALLAAAGGKASFVFARSPDPASNLDMSEMIQLASGIVGGNGGGRPEMARGGGPDVKSMPDALEFVRKIVKERMGGKSPE